MDTTALLKKVKREIERLQQVVALLEGSKGKRKTMSKASRAKIAAAQKARWAKAKKAA